MTSQADLQAQRLEAQRQAAQRQADYQQVVRVVTYAIEDLPHLPDEWFVHMDITGRHTIVRNGEQFAFNRQGFSQANPSVIGFELYVPQASSLRPARISLWIENPHQNVAVNRRATRGALERIIARGNLNISTCQVDATQYQ